MLHGTANDCQPCPHFLALLVGIFCVGQLRRNVVTSATEQVEPCVRTGVPAACIVVLDFCQLLTSYLVFSDAVGVKQHININIRGYHCVKDVQNVDFLFPPSLVGLDLKLLLHEVSHVLLELLLACLASLVLCSPIPEVLDQLPLHIAHVDSRPTDGQSRERHFADKLRCAL